MIGENVDIYFLYVAFLRIFPPELVDYILMIKNEAIIQLSFTVVCSVLQLYFFIYFPCGYTIHKKRNWYINGFPIRQSSEMKARGSWLYILRFFHDSAISCISIRIRICKNTKCSWKIIFQHEIARKKHIVLEERVYSRVLQIMEIRDDKRW